MINQQTRKTYLPPAVLALVTFLVRLIYSNFERTVWGDEPFYLWLGRNWFNGDGYHLAFIDHWDYHHTPGYPFITGALTLLTGEMKRASEWSYILFSILLVLVLYALANRIYGQRTAIAVGAIVALAPATALMPLYWGTMTEVPYWALVFTGILFAHRAYRRWRMRDIVLAALFLALAYFVRPEAIVYLGAMGLALGLRALFESPHKGRAILRRLAYPALLGIVFFAILFPYLNRVRQVTGTWTVSQKVGAHFATASGLAEGGFRQFDLETWGLDSTGEQTRFFSTEIADASALAFIKSNPVGYLKVIYSNTLELLAQILSPRLLPAFALIFLGLALFRRAWDRRRSWDELFLIATLLPGISFVFFFVQERYIATLIPTLFIWYGHGVIELGDWLVETFDNLLAGRSAKRSWSGYLVWLPLAILVLFMLFWTPRQIATATNSGSTRAAHDLAAAAIAPEIQPGDIIMARYVSIPFHAGAEWIPTPAADIDAVLNYARLHGADYWAVDGFEAHNLRPQFAPLVDDPTYPPPGLELVTQIKPDGEEPVILYRILP